MVHLLPVYMFSPIGTRCFGIVNSNYTQGGCHLHGGRQGESYLLDKCKQLVLSKNFYWSEAL